MPSSLRDVIAAMTAIAPPHLAESWDNVGLLAGTSDGPVSRALLTIDMTEEIVSEAVATDAQLLISYHPIFFHPVRRITDADPKGRMLLNLLRHGLAVYSPHTALDAAPRGVGDWLADAVGSGYRRPLAPHADLAPTQEIKVVTFVPPDAVDKVRDALASAGAGRIGKYELCSFAAPGHGTFRGDAGTKPAVGKAGRFERVTEVRLEMLCARAALPVLVATLRQFHPYEEPAFDLYLLHPVPDLRVGGGRKVVLDQPATVGELADRVKKHLRIPAVKVTEPARTVRSVGLVPGAGAALLETAIDEACDLFVTGEMTHHQALDAESRGCSVILTGHTNSERGYLPILKSRLAESVSGVEFVISRADRSRFRVM